MNKRTLLTVIVLGLVVGAWADHVREQQARQKAEAFMTSSTTTRGAIMLTRVYLPLQTKSVSWSETDAPI